MSSQALSPKLSSSSSFNNEQIKTIIKRAADTFSQPNATISSNISNTSTDDMMNQEWIKILITVFAASIMIFIIIAAIFGNLLVIISVIRVRKLR